MRFWQEQGLSSVTASFELRWQQVRDLGKYANCEALIYGRLPLMITENCVTKNSVGCAHGAGSVLTDRRGEQFPGAVRLRVPVRDRERKDAGAGGQAGRCSGAACGTDACGLPQRRRRSARRFSAPTGPGPSPPTTTAHAGCSTGA